MNVLHASLVELYPIVCRDGMLVLSTVSQSYQELSDLLLVIGRGISDPLKKQKQA